MNVANNQYCAEFERLLLELANETISDEDQKHLELILMNDPAARRTYIAYFDTHAMLFWKMGGAKNDEERDDPQGRTALLLEVLEQERVARIRREADAALEKQQSASREAERYESMRQLAGLSKPSADSQTKHYVIPRPLFYGSIAAVVAIAAAILWPLLQPESEPAGPQSPSGPQYFEVATLVEQFEAKWKPGIHRIAVGEPVFNEKMTLEEGLARIRFKDEAELILEGPCTIEPVSESEVRIIGGKLVGVCRTETSRGFIVRSNNARIVDLGTEFGVAVDNEGTLEAHVIEGEVAITPLVPDAPRHTISLTAGAGRRVSADATKIDVIEADQYRFVRGLTPNDRDPMRGYVDAVKSLNPVIYYRFERIESRENIRNEMGLAYPGRVIGDLEIEQVGQVNVAKFQGNHKHGYVRLRQAIHELRGKSEYSVECWIKPDSYHTGAVWSMNLPTWTEENLLGSCAGVVLQSSGEQQRPDWAELLRVIHRSEPSDKGGTNLVTDEPYVLNQWIHLVTVKSASHVRIYINGEMVAEAEDSTQFADVDFSTGVGHHGVDSVKDQDARRYSGLMDEFAVYTRALTKEQIAEHYRHMAPLLGMEE